jgi:RNA polymerase sigma-70 factor (family 1)
MPVGHTYNPDNCLAELGQTISEFENEYNTYSSDFKNGRKKEIRIEQHVEDNLLPFNSGDQSAFTAVYNQLYPSVFYFTCRFVNPEDAEDITADAFCKLWKMRKNFPRLQSIKVFLQVTVRNASFNYLEHRKVVYKLKYEFQNQADKMVEDLTDSVEIREEYLKHIYAGIEKLPDQCKKIFKLAFLEGLKNHEIAGKLHISQNLVSHQKIRGLKLLRLAIPLGSLFAVLFFRTFCNT